MIRAPARSSARRRTPLQRRKARGAGLSGGLADAAAIETRDAPRELLPQKACWSVCEAARMRAGPALCLGARHAAGTHAGPARPRPTKAVVADAKRRDCAPLSAARIMYGRQKADGRGAPRRAGRRVDGRAGPRLGKVPGRRFDAWHAGLRCCCRRRARAPGTEARNQADCKVNVPGAARRRVVSLVRMKRARRAQTLRRAPRRCTTRRSGRRRRRASGSTDGRPQRGMHTLRTSKIPTQCTRGKKARGPAPRGRWASERESNESRGPGLCRNAPASSRAKRSSREAAPACMARSCNYQRQGAGRAPHTPSERRL